MGDVAVKTSTFVYVRRAVTLTFTIGLIVTAILMLLSGAVFARAGEGNHNLAFGPFTFFRVDKETLDGGGTTAQLVPGFGVMVLLVVLPVLAGLTTYLIKKRKKKDVPQA